MAISRQVDLLEPINLAEHLDKVELYLGQVCQIAGISKMQLDYWTNKAQIPTKGKKQRIYDMDALETVMLIKQAKDKGLNLGAAIEAARRFREQDAVLGDLEAALRGQFRDCVRLLRRDGGRRFTQPDELRMGMREARPCGSALVDQGVQIQEALGVRNVASLLPCCGHARDLVVRQL